MDEGIKRPWTEQLDTRRPTPKGEHWAAAFLGWCAMAFLVGAIVMFLVAIQ